MTTCMVKKFRVQYLGRGEKAAELIRMRIDVGVDAYMYTGWRRREVEEAEEEEEDGKEKRECMLEEMRDRKDQTK